MKTLSIKNPWAYLICSGKKDIENRSWPTSYRGRMLVHVSAKLDPAGPPTPSLPPPQSIIGSVEIVGCVRDSRSKWANPGLWHWELANPTLFDRPILNVKGTLSFWEFPLENYPHIKIK
jgi:hypothetical protein